MAKKEDASQACWIRNNRQSGSVDKNYGIHDIKQKITTSNKKEDKIAITLMHI